MLESSRLWWVVFGAFAAGCAAPAPPAVNEPAAPSQPVAVAPVRDESGLAEEARALLAQAETDVQRARAKRALWLKAWESLLAARKAAAASDYSATIRHARH